MDKMWEAVIVAAGGVIVFNVLKVIAEIFRARKGK